MTIGKKIRDFTLLHDNIRNPLYDQTYDFKNYHLYTKIQNKITIHTHNLIQRDIWDILTKNETK
jgi:hypothetical protein